MALVFVSYSRKDEQFAFKLVDDLRAAGVPVWMDQRNIPPGAQWDIAVENALDDSTHLLLILSPASVKSRNVRDEMGIAIDDGKTVLPILLEDCKIPMRVRRMQYTDFRQDYDAALAKLLAVLPRSPESSPSDALNTLTTPERYRLFWQTLLDKVRAQNLRHASITPPGKNVLAASAGYPGLKFRYALHRDNASVQLYIDTKDKRRNKQIFDLLAANKDAIEATFGAKLTWERLTDKRASRIRHILTIQPIHNGKDWDAKQNHLIAAMISFEAALESSLAKLA